MSTLEARLQTKNEQFEAFYPDLDTNARRALLDGADLIARFGLCKGTLWQSDGWEGFCVRGALLRAVGVYPDGRGVTQDQKIVQQRAEEFFMARLMREGYQSHTDDDVPAWNNRADTIGSEAVRLMRAAAYA